MSDITISPWDGTSDGNVIAVHGASGIGKSTLAAQLPKAVFLAVDGGSRKLVNPFTGKKPRVFKADGRPAGRSHAEVMTVMRKVLDKPDACIPVIDTVTRLQDVFGAAAAAKFNTPGRQYKSLDDVPHGRAYPVFAGLWREFMSLCEDIAQKGGTVVLLSQTITRENVVTDGDNYLCSSMDLHAGKTNIGGIVFSACDYVVAITQSKIDVEEKKAKTQDLQREIRTDMTPTLACKRRTKLPNPIPFEDETDTSLWAYLGILTTDTKTEVTNNDAD